MKTETIARTENLCFDVCYTRREIDGFFYNFVWAVFHAGKTQLVVAPLEGMGVYPQTLPEGLLYMVEHDHSYFHFCEYRNNINSPTSEIVILKEDVMAMFREMVLPGLDLLNASPARLREIADFMEAITNYEYRTMVAEIA